MMRFLLIAIVLKWAVPSIARNKSLLRNGDFETDSNQSPPPGWVI
jgi:hypothetical protein